ncbi:MAG: N-acetyltransferase [Coriobacteriia bacterium]|jgi:GNAT superfamily N-acetyltransferase|nr:N-acetyltransferase [Coriobacteriia bacterium]
MGVLTIEQIPLGDPRIREFALMPWRLYRGDPCWTPPLNADLLGSRVLGMSGLLTEAHPYHRHADVMHFIARRDSRAVGRISAAVNHRFNDYTPSYAGIGFFGFFEVEEDYEAASALLDAARSWLAERDMKIMRGPGQYSNATHERQGILIDGFDTPPTVECTHNPRYYAAYLEQWGLAKVKDYHAYLIDMADVPAKRLVRVAEAVRRRNNIVTRPVDMADYEAEMRRVVDIFNRAWSDNWGFLPLTEGEADAIGDSLRPIIDPELVRIAIADGEPVAMIGAFPDPNWALRPRWGVLGDSDVVRAARLLLMRKHIPRLRLMFFGIVPGWRVQGIDALLLEETYRHASAHGYRSIEASLLLEDNTLVLRASELAGGKRYKTWRIYEREI